MWDRHRQMTRWQGSQVTRSPGVETPRPGGVVLRSRASVVRKFHAYNGFAPELVSRTEVADTVGIEGVESDLVGQGELEWVRGAGE